MPSALETSALLLLPRKVRKYLPVIVLQPDNNKSGMQPLFCRRGRLSWHLVILLLYHSLFPLFDPQLPCLLWPLLSTPLTAYTHPRISAKNSGKLPVCSWQQIGWWQLSIIVVNISQLHHHHCLLSSLSCTPKSGIIVFEFGYWLFHLEGGKSIPTMSPDQLLHICYHTISLMTYSLHT